MGRQVWHLYHVILALADAYLLLLVLLVEFGVSLRADVVGPLPAILGGLGLSPVVRICVRVDVVLLQFFSRLNLVVRRLALEVAVRGLMNLPLNEMPGAVGIAVARLSPLYHSGLIGIHCSLLAHN